MDIYEKLKQYQNLQANLLGEILSELNAGNLQEVSEDELWSFNQKLKSGWYVLPHGEHLTCKSDKSVKIEIPLYIIGCIGVDPGHFDEYIQSEGFDRLGYSSIAITLELLEKSGKAKKVSPKNTSVVWRLS